MEYTRKNQGTCARSTTLVIEDGIIKDVNIVGGCEGNLKGIMQLVKGADAKDVAQKVKGITCGKKCTSCPDQLALAIEEALAL